MTNLVNDLSADGFRIISVMDMNAPKYEGNVYLVVAQKELPTQVVVSPGPKEMPMPRPKRHLPPTGAGL